VCAYVYAACVHLPYVCKCVCTCLESKEEPVCAADEVPITAIPVSAVAAQMQRDEPSVSSQLLLPDRIVFPDRPEAIDNRVKAPYFVKPLQGGGAGRLPAMASRTQESPPELLCALSKVLVCVCVCICVCILQVCLLLYNSRRPYY